MKTKLSRKRSTATRNRQVHRREGGMGGGEGRNEGRERERERDSW